MAYTLPQHIDSNKIFLVNKKDTEQRLEPMYYLPAITTLYSQLKQNGIINLGNIVYPIKNGSTPDGGYFENSGVNYYRSQDFDMYDIRHNQYITEEFNEKLLRSKIDVGDILLAVVGATLGKVGYIVNKENCGNINQNVARIRVCSDYIIPNFLAIYLDSNIGQTFIKRLATITTQAYLNNELINQLPVPVLSKDKQQQIIDIYNTAYNQKKAKEQQAKELLASIDEYLLNELGITLPNIDNSLSSRIFIVNGKEISNSRFDPKGVLFLGDKMKSCIYDNIQLKDIAFIQKGTAITRKEIDNNGIYPVIAGGQTSPYNHNKYNYKGNVITVSASGYAGYVWYHENPIFASDCNVIYSKDENSFLTKYIFEVLKSQQEQIYLLRQGAIQPHVYIEDLSKLWIPLLPLKKQKEIADHITEIRQKAKQLQEEAKQLLQQTKDEIEQMILE